MDCSVIPWSELKPEVQAAWVQALGSVAAIFVAIGLAGWQFLHARREAKKERYARGRSVAWSILRILKFYVDDINSVVQSLPDELNERNANDILVQHGLDDRIIPPSRLEDFALQFVDLDIAGKRLQDLLHNARSIEDQFYELGCLSQFPASLPESIAGYADLRRDVIKLQELVLECDKELRSFYK